MDADGPTELDERPQSRREWSGWLRSLVLPLAVIVSIVGGLLYFQTRTSDGGSADGYGAVELPALKNATDKTPAAQAGRAAPDFLLQTLDGGELRLSDLQGRPVLVNFWASWCTTCRQETPGLIEAYEKNKDAGFFIVGVNLQESAARAAGFVDEFEIPFPIAMDRQGQVGRTWRIGGPTQGLPASYFIDARGVVQKVVWGPLRAKEIADGLELVLKSRP